MNALSKGLDAGKRWIALPPAVASLRTIGGLALLAGVVLVAGNSQVPQYNGGLPGPERSASGLPGLPENANPRPDGNRALRDAMNKQEDQKRLKALSVQRQKEMNNETGKLITLANELKAETNRKDHQTSLTVLDLRKVEAIEKLAKSVREKMTGTSTVD